MEQKFYLEKYDKHAKIHSLRANFLRGGCSNPQSDTDRLMVFLNRKEAIHGYNLLFYIKSNFFFLHISAPFQKKIGGNPRKRVACTCMPKL